MLLLLFILLLGEPLSAAHIVTKPAASIRHATWYGACGLQADGCGHSSKQHALQSSRCHTLLASQPLRRLPLLRVQPVLKPIPAALSKQRLCLHSHTKLCSFSQIATLLRLLRQGHPQHQQKLSTAALHAVQAALHCQVLPVLAWVCLQLQCQHPHLLQTPSALAALVPQLLLMCKVPYQLWLQGTLGISTLLS